MTSEATALPVVTRGFSHTGINISAKVAALIFRVDKGSTFLQSGPGSSVGIATDYGLDGPGSNLGGEEIFRPSGPLLGPTQPPVQWVPGVSRG